MKPACFVPAPAPAPFLTIIYPLVRVKALVIASTVAAAAFVGGCASRIETVRVNPVTLEVSGHGVAGVVYYEPKLVKVRYELTELIDKDKMLVGRAEDGSCQQVLQREDILTLPDYQQARAILHKPAWFASSEFGVTLDNGMLVAVTSKAVPQTPQLLEQAVKAASTSAVPGQACNAGPVITRREVVNL